MTFLIAEENDKPSFEFLNNILENKKQSVVADVCDFQEKSSRYIFGTTQPGWLAIPREWSEKNRERFDEAQENLAGCEKKLSENYDDFIKTGRRILKV